MPFVLQSLPQQSVLDVMLVIGPLQYFDEQSVAPSNHQHHLVETSSLGLTGQQCYFQLNLIKDRYLYLVIAKQSIWYA